MILKTTSNQDWGLAIELDNQMLFQVKTLPKSFAFQPSNDFTCFICKEPLDYLSRQKYTLCDSNRTEIASLTGKYSGGELVVGGQSYGVCRKGKAILNLDYRRHSYYVEGLGIEFECDDQMFSKEVKTTLDDFETYAGIVVLLHFARIWILRSD